VLTAPNTLVALAIWAVVLWAPMAIVVGRRQLASHWMGICVIGPCLTLAVSGVVQATTSLANIALHPLAIPITLALVTLLARRLHQPTSLLSNPSGRHILNTAVVAIPTLFWLAMSFAGHITLAGVDGPRHAHFIGEIGRSHSTRPSLALTHFPGVQGAAGTYYQLTVHSLIASLQDLTTAPVASLIQALGVVVGGIIAPVGLLLLCRTAIDDHRISALCAIGGAIAVPSFVAGWGFGWLPYVVGCALVPGALWLAQQHPDRPGWTTVAAGSLFAIHPAAWCTFALVALPTRLRHWRSLVVVGALPLVVVLPEVIRFGWGIVERTGSSTGTFHGAMSIPTVVSLIAGGFGNGFASLLVIPGWIGLMALARRQQAGLLIAAVYLGLSAVAIEILSAEAGRIITVPWNGDPHRLAFTAFVLAIPGAAVALEALWERIRERSNRVTAIALAASIAVISGAGSDNATFVALSSSDQSREQQVVWQWLTDNVPTGGRVAVSLSDDVPGLWMNALARPLTLTGWPPEFQTVGRSWADSLRLISLLEFAPTRDDTRDELSTLVHRYCITHVLADEATTTMIGELSRAGVGRNAAVRAVYRDDNVQVYAVTTPLSDADLQRCREREGNS
jgi:hypothetical protein